MAQDMIDKDFNSMSREELLQIIGMEVDAETPREELITMAM